MNPRLALPLLLAALVSGCMSTSNYRDDVVYDDGSYYSPSSEGDGDYYYADAPRDNGWSYANQSYFMFGAPWAFSFNDYCSARYGYCPPFWYSQAYYPHYRSRYDSGYGYGFSWPFMFWLTSSHHDYHDDDYDHHDDHDDHDEHHEDDQDNDHHDDDESDLPDVEPRPRHSRDPRDHGLNRPDRKIVESPQWPRYERDKPNQARPNAPAWSNYPADRTRQERRESNESGRNAPNEPAPSSARPIKVSQPVSTTAPTRHTSAPERGTKRHATRDSDGHQ